MWILGYKNVFSFASASTLDAITKCFSPKELWANLSDFEVEINTLICPPSPLKDYKLSIEGFTWHSICLCAAYVFISTRKIFSTLLLLGDRIEREELISVDQEDYQGRAVSDLWWCQWLCWKSQVMVGGSGPSFSGTLLESHVYNPG